MKKTNRKLIPSVAMLLVSAIMLSTSSFAWFTINKEVTATGMSIKAENTANLLIENGHVGQMSGMSHSSIILSAAGTIAPAHLTASEGTVTVQVPDTYKASSEPDFNNAGAGATWSVIGTTDIADASASDFTDIAQHVVCEAMTIAKKTPGDAKVATTTINAKVNITFGENKGINGAIRCGFLVGKTFTPCADLNTLKGSKEVTFDSLITLTENTPTPVNFYVWYDGDDDQCTGANAINLTQANSVVITFTDPTT